MAFKTLKDVNSNILVKWEKEWEIWWEDYKQQFEEVDCCDYQDERQAFFLDKLGELGCE